MKERSESRTGNPTSRRTVLARTTAIGVGTVAGCLGETARNEESDDRRPDDDTGDGSDDDRVDVGSDVSEETRDLAADMVAAIDTDLSVTGWRLHGMFVPSYTDSRGIDADAAILGNAYADVVERGFDRRAMPTARTAGGDVDFMVFLEPEWARSYLDGDWSEEAYIAEIIASEH